MCIEREVSRFSIIKCFEKLNVMIIIILNVFVSNIVDNKLNI